MTITMTIENTTDIRIFEQRLHSWSPPPNETWYLYPLFYWTNIPIPLPEQMTERNGYDIEPYACPRCKAASLAADTYCERCHIKVTRVARPASSHVCEGCLQYCDCGLDDSCVWCQSCNEAVAVIDESEEYRCTCGYPIASPGLCGECSCEEDEI